VTGMRARMNTPWKATKEYVGTGGGDACPRAADYRERLLADD
jgi:hypothetical protein